MRRPLPWMVVMLAAASLNAAPSYYRDIRPILQKRCQGCHQPASKASDLDLTTYAEFRKGGKGGPAFVAQKPDDSLTVRYLTAAVQPRMPLGQPELSSEEIDLFREWIRAGALDDSPAEADDNKPSIYLQAPVITALRFSPDGKQLAVSGNREIFLHSADGSSLIKRLPGKAERILSLAFSQDGKLLVAGGGTPAQFGEVQVWDVAAGNQLRAATLTNDTVFGASLSPDASKIAVGCTDNTVHVFDTATMKELFKIGNHENWVLSTAFSVDSKRFVSVSGDRAAKLTDANSGAFLENVNLLRGELAAVARHPKKDVVVLGGEDRYPYIYLLDRPRNMKIADDTTLVRKLDHQDGPITALDWSQDGSLIAVGGGAPSVNLYAAETGERRASLTGHTAGIYAVAFAPDGERIATGGFDGKVRIYSTKDGSLVKDFIPVPLSKGDSGESGGTR